VAMAIRFRSRLTGLTKALNLITAVLVAINVIPIVSYRTPHGPPSTLSGGFAQALAAAKTAKHELPDIYYIVPEDYGDERTLRDEAGIDTHYFVRYLKKQGFYVATDSLANYQFTHYSLSASGNLEYVQTLLGEATATDGATVESTLHGFAASKFLKALGYRYIHMGYWWAPTATDPTADIDVKPGSLSEFSSILYDTTILPTLSRKLAVKTTLDPRRAFYEQSLQELEDILKSSKLRGPKFVFAHWGLPHHPFVFDRNGNFLPKKKESTLPAWKSKRTLKNFADQAYFTTKQLQMLMGRLLDATGRKAVIILQTDEGPDLAHTRIDIRHGRFEREDIRAELLDKYRILNAYFLPGVSHERLYSSITPVNSFRLVFDLYFHAGFGLLRDEIWALERNPAKFVNITKLVAGG
jgi:hypothetical protein